MVLLQTLCICEAIIYNYTDSQSQLMAETNENPCTSWETSLSVFAHTCSLSTLGNNYIPFTQLGRVLVMD